MKYSTKFNSQFSLYLKLYRSGLIDFCGSEIKTCLIRSAKDAKDVFMNFENGKYAKSDYIVTRHPNVVNAVLTAKKGWGLWMDEWSSGIADGLFLKSEIIQEIKDHGIDLPESFMIEFENKIYKRRLKLNKV